MSGGRTYLDYNASAPVRPDVQQAVAAALMAAGNASSVHAEGRQAKARIERAREAVAALVGAEPANVIFTSGGSEANAAALAPAHVGHGGEGECALLFVSAIEHPSVLAGGRFPPHAVRHLPVTAQGSVDVGACEAAVRAARAERPQRPIMVSVMAANNETGAVQPVAEIARIAHAHGAVVHCDAVQAAGKVPVDVAALGVDMMSLSAHKIGGPQGVGALVLGAGVTLAEPLVRGGGQERRRRAGTENVAGIAGFGVAAELAAKELAAVAGLAALRDRLEAAVTAEGAVIFAREAERLPNTSLFALPGLSAETAVIALDLAGIAVSSGAACSSGKVARSHVLEAMGVESGLAAGAVRVSLGWASRPADVERFLAAWSDLARRRARRAAA